MCILTFTVHLRLLLLVFLCTLIYIMRLPNAYAEPKFLSPQHDQRNPRTLLWMDRAAIEDRTRTAGRSPILLTETISTNNNDDTDSSNTGPNPFPVKPDANTVGEFKVTPFTHAGYAVTWFGLSGAGMVMTRKLLTRGW